MQVRPLYNQKTRIDHNLRNLPCTAPAPEPNRTAKRKAKKSADMALPQSDSAPLASMTSDARDESTPEIRAPPHQPHLALLNECDTAISQFKQVPNLWALLKKRTEQQLALDLLATTSDDWEAVGTAGKMVETVTAAVLQQPLSEADYWGLASRYEALVQKMANTCKDLQAARQYDSVIALGAKLKELKEAWNTAVEQVEAVHYAAVADAKAAELWQLTLSCDAVAAQFAYVPALQNAIQIRDSLQGELTSLRGSGSNFREIVRVGTALKAAKAAVAQQQLSEANYLTLPDRHAALVQKVTDQCKKLADAEDYDALEALAIKLEELILLDVKRGAISHLPVHEGTVNAIPQVTVAAAPEEASARAAAVPEPTPLCKPPALALCLPTYPPATEGDSPDWLDVGGPASTESSGSDDISVASTTEPDRVELFSALPFHVK
jgi:hypothetical protein